MQIKIHFRSQGMMKGDVKRYDNAKGVRYEGGVVIVTDKYDTDIAYPMDLIASVEKEGPRRSW
jgi:hypothetical protein